MGFKSLNNWLAEQTVKGKKFIDNGQRDYYGCVMMDSKIPDWEDMHLAGIDEEDVHVKPLDDSYGLEEEPHVTVLFGLHEDQVDSETIKEVIKHNMKPLTVTIDEVDYFPGEEYDVVKYNVPVTPELQGYRDLFMKFPNTQTFPEYKPHMTLAYVKPGKGKKYKRKLREPFQVTFTKGTYSDHPEGDKSKFTRKQIDLEKEYKTPVRENENIRFERGQDPKDAMEVGIFNPNLEWYFNAYNDPDRWEIWDKGEYKGIPILILKSKLYERNLYTWDSPIRMMGGPMDYTPEESIVRAKNEIDEYIDFNRNAQNESIDFERGIDPKKGLNIGNDRILSKEELIEIGTPKIFNEVKKWVQEMGYKYKKWTPYDDELQNEIGEFIDMVYDEFEINRLSELAPSIFKEYWKDVHLA